MKPVSDTKWDISDFVVTGVKDLQMDASEHLAGQPATHEKHKKCAVILD
jgi:hypothetical protein